MKNISLIINAVLGVAVIVLFILVLGSKNNGGVQGIQFGSDSTLTVKLPIA